MGGQQACPLIKTPSKRERRGMKLFLCLVSTHKLASELGEKSGKGYGKQTYFPKPG